MSRGTHYLGTVRVPSPNAMDFFHFFSCFLKQYLPHVHAMFMHAAVWVGGEKERYIFLLVFSVCERRRQKNLKPPKITKIRQKIKGRIYSDGATNGLSQVNLNNRIFAFLFQTNEIKGFFSFILLTHEGSHREVYRDFQPSYDIFRRWCQGFFRPQVPYASLHCPIASSASTQSQQTV